MKNKGSIKGVSYFLGKKQPIENLGCFSTKKDSITSLKEKGIKSFHESNLSPIEMALKSSQKTIDKSSVNPEDIEAVIYASTSFWQKSFYTEQGITWLMNELGLKKAFPIGVFMPGCANFFTALNIALNMVKQDGYRNVLIVTTDKVNPEKDSNRVMWPDVSVLSDGAASCIVSPFNQGEFNVRDLRHHSDPSMWNLSYEENYPGFLLKTIKGAMSMIFKIISQNNKPNIVKLITNNYNNSIMETTASKLGFNKEQTFLNNVGNFGHCYAADTLINLNDYSKGRNLNKGDEFLLLGTGHKHWGAAILEVN